MKSIRVSLSQHEEIQRCADYQEDDQRQHEILLDTAGLNDTQSAAKPVGDIRRAIADESVDDRQIDVVAHRIANPLCAWTKQMQDAIDHTLIHEPVHHVFREPVGRFDEDRIVDLVEVIFSLQEIDLESVFGWRVDITVHEVSER